MAGLGLAIASLGWVWENMTTDYAVRLIGAAIAAALLVVLAAKFISQPKTLFNELAHPVVGSVIPTFAMGMMVISSAINLYHTNAAEILWLTAVTLHCAFLLIFFTHRAKGFKLHHMLPSWFVPPVGLAVAALTCPSADFYPLANTILLFAMTSYLLLMPVMIYRLLFAEAIPDTAKPTIAIMAAPASLCLAAYLSLVDHPSLLLTGVLAGIAVLMTVVIYMAFFQLLKLPFSPGYAAFTFPTVISATALFKTAELVAQYPGISDYASPLNQGAVIELLIATVIVGYVAAGYVNSYFSRAA
jgi:tellurite resistance protein TehA-like permease